MRKIIFCLLLIWRVTSSLQAEEQAIRCEKTYINPCDIYFDPSNLLVLANGVLLYPESIHLDTGGYYFETIRYDELKPGPWQCTTKGCLAWNEEWRDRCKQCGKPK